jgi:hypothetical protein
MLRRVFAIVPFVVVSLSGVTRADVPTTAVTRVAARLDTPGALNPIELRQHRLAPMHEGDVRTFTITGREGRRATAATLTERVTSLTLAGDVLRADIAATWIATGGHAMTGYQARRVEEVDRDGLVRATNRLDRAPIPGSAIAGISLPRKLDVGRTWTVVLDYKDGGRSVTARMQRRVAGKVLRRAPDGRVLPGVLIEWSEVRSVAGDRPSAAERWSGTSIYLEGVGELETHIQRAGGHTWFDRRLAAFRPGN